MTEPHRDALLDGLTKTFAAHAKTAIGSQLVPALVITALKLSTSHCTDIPDRTKWARGMMCFDLVTLSLQLGGVWSHKRMVDLYGMAKLDTYGMMDGASAVERFEGAVWGALTASGLSEVTGKPTPGNIIFGGTTPLGPGTPPHHVGIAAFDGSVANINLTPGDTMARVPLDKFRGAFAHVYEAAPPA